VIFDIRRRLGLLGHVIRIYQTRMAEESFGSEAKDKG
jgi:hypothetical protein